MTSEYHTGKLSLHGGREIGVFDIAINWRLRSKHGIKVGDILIYIYFVMFLTWVDGRMPTTGLATLGLKGG